jgi:hypothetical protein
MVHAWGVELEEQVLPFAALEFATDVVLVLVEAAVVVSRWPHVLVVVKGSWWRRRSWGSVDSVMGWTRRVPQIVLVEVVAAYCGVFWMRWGCPLMS